MQETYSAKGIYADWNHLGDISASISHTEATKKKVGKMFDTAYKKKTHSQVDTTDLVWDVVRAIQHENLLDNIVDRKLTLPTKLVRVTDARADGYQKLKASIKSFNKRMTAQWSEEVIDAPPPEEDELLPMQWGPESEGEIA